MPMSVWAAKKGVFLSWPTLWVNTEQDTDTRMQESES